MSDHLKLLVWLYNNTVKLIFNYDGSITIHAPGHPSKTSFDDPNTVIADYREQVDSSSKKLKELGYD